MKQKINTKKVNHRIKKQREATLAASVTVEATLIFPVLLVIILALVQLCLWQHDRLVLQSALNRSSLYAIAGSKGDFQKTSGYQIGQIASARQFFAGEKREELQRELELFLAGEQEKLLLSSVSGIRVSLQNYRITTEAVLTADSILPGFSRLFPKQTLQAEGVQKKTCPAAEAKSRLAAAILEAGSRLEFVGGWGDGTGQ